MTNSACLMKVCLRNSNPNQRNTRTRLETKPAKRGNQMETVFNTIQLALWVAIAAMLMLCAAMFFVPIVEAAVNFVQYGDAYWQGFGNAWIRYGLD
jgi:hypothetical protein